MCSRWETLSMKILPNAKIVQSFYCSRRYLIPNEILYLYKMEYCCWGGVAQSTFSCLDKVQNRLWNLVLFSSLQLLPYRKLIASLCSITILMASAQLSFTLVPPCKIFTANTRLATITVSNFHYFLSFIAKTKIPLAELFF